MHELPQLLDGARIAADEQRPQVLLDQALHRQVPVGEGGAAETDQARLVGLDLDHHEVDALGCGQDDFDVGDQRGHVQSTESQPPST